MALTHHGFDLQILAKVRQFKTELNAQQGAGAADSIVSFMEGYAVGNGQNRVDAIYSAYSPAFSTTALDLRGTLTGPFGDAVTFPVVMGIFVKNLSTTPGVNLTIGGGSNPFITWVTATGDSVVLGPGGIFALWSPIDGYATTAGTGDILTITPSTGTPPVAYMVVGRSA